LAGAVKVVEGQSRPTLRIGLAPWADAEIVALLASWVLEQRLQQPVELVMLDLESVYQELADGQIDLMLMSWQPLTHMNLLDLVQGKSEDLGAVYRGARLGWVVPSYVPEQELRSIGDLAKPENRRRLRGVVQGIDPASGLMQLSNKAVDVYELEGYRLRSASASGLDLAIRSAVKRGEWVVATAWTPHWIFARYDLRFLDDPKGVLGATEAVHALGRIGFSTDFPAAARFLKDFRITITDLETMMLDATRSSPQGAVESWIESHSDNVGAWLASAA
jgi:glycine betaine/proline transport system substrate-binding protein